MGATPHASADGPPLRREPSALRFSRVQREAGGVSRAATAPANAWALNAVLALRAREDLAREPAQVLSPAGSEGGPHPEDEQPRLEIDHVGLYCA